MALQVTEGTGPVVKTTITGDEHIGHVHVDSSALPAGAATAANQSAAVTALQIMDDWDESDRAKVNLIASQAGITGGAGAVAANTPRMTLASDDPAVAALGTSNTNTSATATSLAIIDDWDESDRAKVNIIAGQAGITGGAGAVAANTPRVTLASDDPAVALLGTIDADTGNAATALQIIDDWDESDRAKVNIIVGQAGVAAGAGAVGASVQRMTLASDDPAVALLGTMDADTSALAATIASGRVKVAVDTAIAAGTNNIGDVDILSVSGGVAANAADTATPVKVGARYDSTTPTYDNGDVTNLQADARGSLHVALRQPGSDAPISAGNSSSDGLSDGTIGLSTRALGYIFNGASFDRVRGDVTNGIDVDVTRLPTDAQVALDVIASNTQLFRPVDGEIISVSGTKADSSDLPAGRVWVKGNVDFHISIGADPTATTATSPPLSAHADYYFNVEAGDEVSVIKASGAEDGTVWIATESAIA